MRLSQIFFRTLREDPADAEIASHRLMLRAGLIRKLASGLYVYLPLGQKLLLQVIAAVREQMNHAGAAEVGLTALQPAELWRESGRWQVYGPEMMRLEDRHGREFCLGPTHEEVITDVVRHDTKSWRQLPFNLYQIQTKYRDEVRPRFGLMRAREFLMKDAYSFHAGEDCLRREYQNMRGAYTRLFTGLGLRFVVVQAHAGAIGGTGSEEFQVLADTGENTLVTCPSCGYAANVEQAPCAAPPAPATPPVAGPTQDVPTPNCKTIEAVSAFLGEPPSAMMKNILFVDDAKRFFLVSVRADHEVNPAKLEGHGPATGLRPATEEEIVKELGLPVGYITPQELPAAAKAKITTCLDHTLLDGRVYITGSNTAETHRRGVAPGGHFTADVTGDFRFMTPQDRCPGCGGAPVFARGTEVGHIFMLGTKYSEKLGATFQDEDNSVKPIVMGCYGIGVGRTLASLVEQGNDEKGIVWPRGPQGHAVAPCEVALLPLEEKGPAWEFALSLYDELKRQGVDVILDDRRERPGVKFADAELVGFPWRVVLGKGYEKNGELEMVRRDTGEKILLPVQGQTVAQVADLLKQRVRG